MDIQVTMAGNTYVLPEADRHPWSPVRYRVICDDVVRHHWYADIHVLLIEISVRSMDGSVMVSYENRVVAGPTDGTTRTWNSLENAEIFHSSLLVQVKGLLMM
jgi:hypothetical protein